MAFQNKSLFVPPIAYHAGHAAVNVNASRFTLPGIFLRSAERQLDKQCRADGKHGLEHTVGENKMRAVLIYDRLDFAGVRFLHKAFFHTADIFCGVPKCVVLCAYKKQLAADILDLYEFLLGNRVRRFRVVKQLAGGNHIAGAFGLLRDYAPIVRVLIAKRHVWQGLSLVRKE